MKLKENKWVETIEKVEVKKVQVLKPKATNKTAVTKPTVKNTCNISLLHDHFFGSIIHRFLVDQFDFPYIFVDKTLVTLLYMAMLYNMRFIK